MNPLAARAETMDYLPTQANDISLSDGGSYAMRGDLASTNMKYFSFWAHGSSAGMGKWGFVETPDIERHEGVPAPVRTDRDSTGAPTSSSGGAVAKEPPKPPRPLAAAMIQIVAAPAGRGHDPNCSCARWARP